MICSVDQTWKSTKFKSIISVVQHLTLIFTLSTDLLDGMCALYPGQLQTDVVGGKTIARWFKHVKLSQYFWVGEKNFITYDSQSIFNNYPKNVDEPFTFCH